MENLESSNINIENTHTVDQNGVALGEQNSSLNSLKLELTETQHERQSNDNQLQQVQFGFSHQNLLPTQQNILHSIATADQSYILQHTTNPVFATHITQDASQQNAQQNPSFPCNFRPPISSYNVLDQNNVDYNKISQTSNHVDFSNDVNTLNTANNFNITDLSNTHKQPEKQLEHIDTSHVTNNTTSEELKNSENLNLIDSSESSHNENELGSSCKSVTEEQDGDNSTSEEEEEEDDVHQCGRCKEVFRTLQQYIDHKSSKVCKPAKLKKTTPPQSQQQQQTLSQSQDNILETAAKNTIFRDSFISMDHNDSNSNLEVGKDELLSSVDDAFKQSDMELHHTDISTDSNIKPEMSEQPKKRRGRPPKSSYVPLPNTPTTSNTDLDMNPDSPPKAKRKSRPPRRHKPDEDLTTSDSFNQVAANPLPTDSLGNVTLSSLDPSGLPTVENIHKYFSVRGRGRGRGRARHAMHRCPICQLLFPNRLTMMEHKRKHTKTFKCKICNEGFYTEEKLEKHSTKETHNYPCDQCERIFVNKQALMRHKLSHSDKIFKCDKCARAFKTQKDLNNHKLGMHSETHDFVCEVCNKGFSRREKLKRHLMIHAPDRPIFTCPFKNHVGCEKTFYRKDKLQRHLYSHSKVKPFKCEQCDKSFARTDNLREHIRSHTGIFRYYCTVCGKGQPGPKKFLQHMAKQHNVNNPTIPKPFEDLAPEPLIRQHKAVVEAETAARLARAATNLKKDRDKAGGKLRKEELETQEIHVDPNGHITLANLGNIQLQTVNSALIASPQQPTSAAERNAVEALYSPQFQISRHVPESMVRQIGESLMREIPVRNDGRELSRDGLTQNNIRHLTTAETTEVRIPDLTRQHLVDSTTINAEQLRRQISDGSNLQQQNREEQQAESQPQPITHTLTVEAESEMPATRSLQLIHQIPGSNLQFTTLLNSELVAISDVRNPNALTLFQQQKFTQNQ